MSLFPWQMVNLLSGLSIEITLQFSRGFPFHTCFYLINSKENDTGKTFLIVVDGNVIKRIIRSFIINTRGFQKTYFLDDVSIKTSS